MMPVLLLLLVLVEEGAGRNVVQFTENSRLDILKDIFGGTDSTDARAGLGRKERLQDLLDGMLEAEGWLPVRILAMAVTVGLEFSKPVISVRGPTSNCHFAPVCLDLACGKCYDPMTSLHGDCGSLSFFRCSSLLPQECLPWTCATGGSLTPSFLRNFLPRSAGCGSTALNIITAENTKLSSSIQLTGLGLTMNSLTRCSEEDVCWDSACNNI
ncbi:uncharacterized protein LOC111698076 [Eurytemora carolleeae]|uniref:uncharacterized protein LOC111698076 n=1 Tax=Eurytemora carolleeae TaxID=1294199 RepID=UPI000C784FBE|nr:uncharacterized protein LOC111698076 [Eurytemora carolleeae]|eukprot:XP_023324121.1 uncharacterized protein LOC111698076 [Eurytemora affinis]